jgi:hypothetical protein
LPIVHFFVGISRFLNTLHRDLGGSKQKNSSIVYQTFQGEVQVIDPIENLAIHLLPCCCSDHDGEGLESAGA